MRHVQLALLLLAAPASAELADTYRQWAAGPPSYLFTAAERSAWESVTSDEQADLFVRLFWAKRDPDSSTPENEFRQGFEQRVGYADKQFASASLRGAMTDRGHTFVVFGPPYRVVRPASAGASEGGDAGDFGATPGGIPSGGGAGQFGTGGSTDRAGVASQETWVYEKDKKPKAVTKTKLEVKFRSVPGKDQMIFHKGDDVLGLLAAEAAAAVLRPELTAEDIRAAAPPPVATATAWHAAAADPGQLGALRQRAADQVAAAPVPAPAAPGALAPPPAAGSTTLDTGLFQATDGTWIVPFQISLPAAAAPGHKLLADVSKADGTPAISFVSSSGFETFGDRAYVQDTLVLPADGGPYTLVAGLVDAAGNVGFAASRPLPAPPDATSFWVSELLLSDNIYSLDHKQEMIEPFSWGGVAIVPKGDNVFPNGTALWFYVHVCNASLGPDGKPTLKTIVDLKGKRKFRGAMAIEATKLNDRCFILAQAIDLLAQFVPGDYQLGLEITDTTTATDPPKPEVRTRPFSIPAAPAAAPTP